MIKALKPTVQETFVRTVVKLKLYGKILYTIEYSEVKEQYAILYGDFSAMQCSEVELVV